MKTQSSTDYNWDRAALGACFAIMLTGLIVLVGWHAHVRAAIQIFRGLIPMQYNTALCFLSLGVAGVGLVVGRRALVLGGGIFVALMGVAVVLEYTTGASLGVDTLFFYPWDLTLSSVPGRMALTTAISFFLTGAMLVAIAVRPTAYAIFGIVNSIPLSLALTSLIGYSFQIAYVLPFGLGSQMALHTSAAFLAYGIVMVRYAWKHAERGPEGLPTWGAGIGVAMLPVLLVGAGALFPNQTWRVVTLEGLFSILAVWVLTFAVGRLKSAKVAYKGLLMIAVPLVLLLSLVGLVERVRHQSESAQLGAQRSKEAIGISNALLAQVTEAESAVRGYVITGDETYDNSFTTSAESVKRTMKEFQNLVNNNQPQEERARRILQLMTQRMDRLFNTVRLMKAGNTEQAEKGIREGSGTELMKQVRAEMGGFSKEEDRFDAERRLVLERSWQRLSWLLVADTAAAIILASILTLLFSGGISSRLQQLRDNALSLAAGKELPPSLTGHDEIAELDRVFHEMAESLDEVTRREKAVIEGTTDGIFVKDLEHRYLMINKAGADLLGKTVEEVAGSSVHDLLAPETAARIIQADDELLAAGKTTTYELLATTKAGVERTYLTTRGPYRDRRGNIVGLIGINRDISGEKQARQALATSEQRYRHLVDSGQGLICTHDLDGQLLSVNPAAAESLGYTPDEMVDRSLAEFLAAPVHLSDYLSRIRSEPHVHGLLRMHTKQGDERIWMYHNSRIVEPGTATYVLGYAQDVTDSNRIEENLRMLTQRLSLAARVGNIGIWDWDVETNSITWDERMFEIYGLAQDTAMDYEGWSTRVVAEDLPAAEASLQQTMEGRGEEVAEFRINRGDGTVRHVQAAQGVILIRGKVARMIGINVDITDRKELENTLRQERIFLRTLIDSLPDSVYVKDLACRKVIANLAEVRLSGLASEGEMLGKDDFALYSKDVAEQFFADDQVVLKTGQPVVNREEYLFNKQGKKIWLLTTKIPFRDDKGQIVGLIGLGHDITERKRTDEALIESERRFRDLFYEAPVGYHELDNDGRITCVNTTELQMLGYSSDEMIGHHVWEFIDEADTARMTFAEKMAGRESTPSVERSFRRKDGTLMAVQLDDQILNDPSGRIIGIRATLQDITERKRIVEELKTNEMRMSEAQRIAHLGSWDFDAVTGDVRWSDELWRIFGLEPRPVGLSFQEYLLRVHPEDRNVVGDFYGESPQSKSVFSHDYRIIRGDGSVRVLHANGRVIRDEDGQMLKVTGTDQDITEQKRIEDDLALARDEALESVRLKSQFLANMSHEIRTPMNGVIGMTGLLLETDLTLPQREFTDTIQSSAEALLRIINDILDFSKIEAGLLRFEKIDFDLRGVVEAPVDLLAEKAQAKGLELACLISSGVPTSLRGDAGRLRQVLTNLIGNAVKFTNQGEVVVRVTKTNETALHAMLRFEIQDTGIGISEEIQRGLFRAFVQADGSTTRRYGGTGLGLAISRQLVALMDGEIGIESRPGHGSTFWFTAGFEKQSEPQTIPSGVIGNLSAARVLIVDDNAANRGILHHQTTSWGMIATEAESGARALEELRAAARQGESYDIAILDLMMPTMDGFQLAEAIKSDPSISSVALVLLSLFGESGHAERARQVGIIAYQPKPVKQSQLYDCLTAVMAHSSGGSLTSGLLITRHSLRESKIHQKEHILSSIRVLVAEDNFVNQRVALGQLNNLGYRAEAVSDGRELLKVLETHPVDIILMDCQMPEMDGFAATAEIRRREGTSRHTTIIAMTANALDGDDQKCFAAGMDDYLSKPVKAEVLRKKLERWTRG